MVWWRIFHANLHFSAFKIWWKRVKKLRMLYIYIYIYIVLYADQNFFPYNQQKKILFIFHHSTSLSFLPNTNERKKTKKIFSVLCIFFISSTFSSSQSNITKLDKRRNVKFFWVILELMFYAILKILSAYQEIMNLRVCRPFQIEINDTVLGLQ